MNDVAAIVLSAGRSRRMGACKALLPFGDSTVVESCISNLRAAGIEDIVVVVGPHGAEIREQLKALTVTFAVNSDPDSEMGESIARGVEQVKAGVRAVIIALVDHPAVSATTIKVLIDEWRRGARLVQPEYKRRGGHPVLIDLEYRNELQALDPEGGLRGLFTAHRDTVKRVPVTSSYVARDMDTWEDYGRLYEDVFGVAPPKN